MRIAPAAEYFGGRWIPSSHVLAVPDRLEHFYKACLALEGEARDRMLAALRHLQISDDALEFSTTYCQIAMVSAIETLSDYWGTAFWKDRKCAGCGRDGCKGCNQDIYSAGLKFREFLKTYSVPDEHKLYSTFYKTRSKALHRGAFLKMEYPIMDRPRMDGVEEFVELRNLSILTRIALINWMLNPRLEPVDWKNRQGKGLGQSDC